jgi:hypothetical protein
VPSAVVAPGLFPCGQRFKLLAFLATQHLTTYFFTEISIRAMIASIANSGERKRIAKSFQIG